MNKKYYNDVKYLPSIARTQNAIKKIIKYSVHLQFIFKVRYKCLCENSRYLYLINITQYIDMYTPLCVSKFPKP